MMPNTVSDELREKLKMYPLSEIAKLANLKPEQVANFMDGGDLATLKEVVGLTGAEITLRRAREAGNECDCPLCSIGRALTNDNPDVKVQPSPGGLIIMIAKKPDEPKTEPPRPGLWQRLKGLVR